MCLRWRRPCRVKRALSDYVFQVEDLCDGHLDNIHASRLKHFRDSEIDEVAIMSLVFQSETGKVGSRLLVLEKSPDGLFVHVRRKGLDHSEDSLEHIVHVYGDVPVLFKKLLERRSATVGLASKVRSTLAL